MTTVVYSSPFVPAEWIAAHGARPKRIRPDAGAAAFDRDGSPPTQAAYGSLPHGIPVAVIGGPLMHGDARVFDWIEEAGGVVVLDGTESGARTLPAPFDRRRLRDEPVLELVDAYFGSIPDAFRRPDDALVAWLGRELTSSGARAIILWRYVWCDLWAAFAARAGELAGLPVLDLDVSGDEGADRRTANRLQTFLEVLR